MNTFIKIIGILVIGSALARAVEYKTLLSRNNEAKSISVLSTDKIDLLQFNVYNVNGGTSVEVRFEGEDEFTKFNPAYPAVITGINMIKFYSGTLVGTTYGPVYSPYAILSLSITHTEELSRVGPTSVLVIPENSTGNYDVVVESSGDMTTWSPFVSQTVQSDAAKNFFRVRIVKK